MRTLGLLPNAGFALVEEQKVVDYLLASRHPAGRAKAAVFQRFGFDVENWTMLRDALVYHARTAKMMSVTENEFGQNTFWRADYLRLTAEACGFAQSGL